MLILDSLADSAIVIMSLSSSSSCWCSLPHVINAYRGHDMSTLFTEWRAEGTGGPSKVMTLYFVTVTSLVDAVGDSRLCPSGGSSWNPPLVLQTYDYL